VRTFDRLFADAALLIERGQHLRDCPPAEGGRWPVSVVLRADPASAKRLETAMCEVERCTGPGHFETGIAGSVHFTVRVLERYRETTSQGDEALRRYARAVRRAAGQVGEIELDLIGLTLAPGSVMVCAYPANENAVTFADLLGCELGADAWREAQLSRTVWYANILHFAADIAAPAQLIEWVGRRRELDLVRFRYEENARGRLMRPEVLATARTSRRRGPPR
jgi:hypothetical protein